MNRATPHSSLQRHARSRAALIDDVLACMDAGESLPTIAGRKRMPRERTVARWLDEDGALRERFEAARRARLQAMADEVIALADAYAATAPAKKRSVAVRMQIDARKWWSRMVASEIQTQRRDERWRESAERPATKGSQPGAHVSADELRERLRRYEEMKKQWAAEDGARAAARQDAPRADVGATTVFAPAPRAQPSVPEGRDADGGNGETPSVTPPARDTGGAPPRRTPEPPPMPLVPQWVLDPPERPEPPYDPLRW